MDRDTEFSENRSTNRTVVLVLALVALIMGKPMLEIGMLFVFARAIL